MEGLNIPVLVTVVTTIGPKVSQKGKNKQNDEYNLLPVVVVVVVFCARVNIRGTIIATDTRHATNIVIKSLHSFVFPPQHLNNEY